MTLSFAHSAAQIITSRAPGFAPKIGLILGSGLGSLAEHIQTVAKIPYEELPGFHAPSVEGHSGTLYLGTLNGVPVACLKGRAHLYEGISNVVVQNLIRTLKLLGCEILFATNAAGSLRENVKPGALMLVTDHINFQFSNPLVGINDAEFGPRFVALEDAYDPRLRQQLLVAAAHLQIPLAQGVYLSCLGPSFETPAEIRAFRIWGADAVGMSTVPEVIVARHCQLRVAVISVITNLAAGMSAEKLNHEETLRVGNLASAQLIQLVMRFLENYQ